MINRTYFGLNSKDPSKSPNAYFWQFEKTVFILVKPDTPASPIASKQGQDGQGRK